MQDNQPLVVVTDHTTCRLTPHTHTHTHLHICSPPKKKFDTDIPQKKTPANLLDTQDTTTRIHWLISTLRTSIPHQSKIYPRRTIKRNNSDYLHYITCPDSLLPRYENRTAPWKNEPHITPFVPNLNQGSSDHWSANRHTLDLHLLFFYSRSLCLSLFKVFSRQLNDSTTFTWIKTQTT